MISPALYAELSKRQDALEDELEALAEASHVVSAALRSERSALLAEISTTRRRKKGAESHQLEIEGTEVGARRKDPLVLEILRLTAPKRAGSADEQRAGRDLDRQVAAVVEHLGIRGEPAATKPAKPRRRRAGG